VVLMISKLELFSVISKIIGIFMLTKAIEAFGDFGTSFTFLSQIPKKNQVLYMIISFFPLLIFLLLSLYFIKSSKSIARKLYELNEGDTLRTDNFNHHVLLQVSVFSIGIFIFFTTIPKLSGIMLLVFQGIFSTNLIRNIVETCLSLVLGGVLIFHPKVFSNFADRRLGKE